jgi:LDH2 family malate/lactate/ureidoglycolate dehydrogenase
MRRFPASVLREQVATVLRTWNMPPDTATRTAEILVDADLLGIDSHGISMLPLYESKLTSGGLRLDTTAEVVHDDGGAVVVIDGAAGLGHVVAADAMQMACDRAARFGIGLAVVRNSHHFGAAGYYARLAADQGKLGLVTTSTHTLSQAPTGGAERRLGTNPIAFAAPAERHPPVVLDMATTVVAANKVKTYALADRDLPAEWVIDGRGSPVHDSHAALNILSNQQEGGLLPVGGLGTVTGGHKGYGLAMMVQILSCALSGAGQQGAGPADDIGHMLLAIDPAAFGAPTQTARYVDSLIDFIHETTPLDPATPVLVPGEPEVRTLSERSTSGIPLASTLVAQLREICRRHGASFLLDAPVDPPT